MFGHELILVLCTVICPHNYLYTHAASLHHLLHLPALSFWFPDLCKLSKHICLDHIDKITLECSTFKSYSCALSSGQRRGCWDPIYVELIWHFQNGTMLLCLIEDWLHKHILCPRVNAHRSCLTRQLLLVWHRLVAYFSHCSCISSADLDLWLYDSVVRESENQKPNWAVALRLIRMNL